MLALDYIGVMGDASMVVFFIAGGLSIAGRVRRMAEALKQLEQVIYGGTIIFKLFSLPR